ncbi:MAG: hypothetical protein WAQ28_09920 [Bacteroidia bacterium]|jgi:ElaB/YqjD/DUF883 family membrane-anchored ribosome-binding protein
MNDILKIETILGYVANINRLRASRDGKEFEGILPAPAWSEVLVRQNGNVTDTVSEMKKVIKQYAWQTEKLAPMLKGKDVYDTCRNIWNFLFLHTKYKEDEDGKEQLRTPALSWAVRQSRGIDCDDFTIFAGCLLYNLKIPAYIRIARYKGKNYFQHVYPVIPLTEKRYITLDAVLDQYDAEKPTIETKDFLIMNTNNLNGIDISVLGGIEDDELNELSGILSGEDFNGLSELEGEGDEDTRQLELRAIRNHLERTRSIIQRSPHLIKDVEHPESFLGMLNYALRYWDTNKREEALGILSGEEDRINELEGVSGLEEGDEDVELMYGLNGMGNYDVLGKVKRQRKFFTKVKTAVKKAGQGIKKAAKTLVRYNPLTVTIRAAVLLALKVNLMKVSSKLKWGYLTEAEAKARGFDLAEWKKVKEQLAQAEKLFVNTLQGKAEAFKKAILSGRAGKLSGTDLGVVVAAGTAASTTVAVPFITKIMNLLKKVNFKKLVSKVSAMKMQDKAEVESEGGEEGESTGEEGEETTNGSEDGEGSTALTRMKKAGGEDSEQEGFVAKAMNWVKENPTTSILMGAGAAFLIYQVVKPKKDGLSGVRRGRKKKGKAKNNPPRVVTGVSKRSKRKKRKATKKFKL